MQAFNVFCKKCGNHILAPHPHFQGQFVTAGAAEKRAFVPGGICPECKTEYNTEDPATFESKPKGKMKEKQKKTKVAPPPKKIITGPLNTTNSL